MKNQKVNGKSLSSVDTTEKKYKHAVEWFSNVRLGSIDTDRVWQKISDGLENMDKKVLSWFMLTATTCTMLVAAGLEYFDNFHYESQPSIKENNELSITEFDLNERNNIELDELKPLSSKNITQETISEKPETIQMIQPVIAKDTNHLEGKQEKSTQQIRPRVNMAGKLNYFNQGLSPEVGIDLVLFKQLKGQRSRTFKIGYSVQMTSLSFMQENEKASKRQLNHFVNMTYSTRSQRNKGWDARLGYLINPDSQTFDNSTLRASVHRKINKHVGIGPELIMTNGFKTVYPGISLLVGS